MHLGEFSMCDAGCSSNIEESSFANFKQGRPVGACKGVLGELQLSSYQQAYFTGAVPPPTPADTSINRWRGKDGKAFIAAVEQQVNNRQIGDKIAV